jgi:hypothetical protein
LRGRWLTASRRPAEERDLHFDFVGPKFPAMPDEAGLCRRMCVEISRLRTNHSLLLLKTMSTYDPIEYPSNTCPDCSQGALDDAEHMLSLCPCHYRLRFRLFGAHVPPLRGVFDDVTTVADFIRRSGRLA